MAATEAFKDVLDYISRSNLNFSIYQTPFSAQLSLKKSYAKYFTEDRENLAIQEVTKNNSYDKLEKEFKELIIKLKDCEIENKRLLSILQEKASVIENLEHGCSNLEDIVRADKKKMKKERQKIEKKIVQQKEPLVKLEASSEEENECLIPDISTSNKFGTLAKLNDKKIKTYSSEKLKDLTVCINLSCEFPPSETVSSSVQTVENIYEIKETQTSCFDVLSYSCFYCENTINSEIELNSHRRLNHERFLDETNLECEKCKAVCRDSRDLNMHNEKFHSWNIPPNHAPSPSYPPSFLFQTSIPCYTCGEKLANKVEERKHYDVTHPEMKLYWCEVCLTNFERERGLKSHMRNFHQDFS